MKKSIAMLGMVLMLAGCAAAESEPLAAEPAALVEISPATEETAQTVEAAETTNPAQTATPAPTQDPIPMPTAEPTPAPTAAPTAAPTQAPVEESVADTPAQVNMSYGAVPFDLAAGTEHRALLHRKTMQKCPGALVCAWAWALLLIRRIAVGIPRNSARMPPISSP